MNYGEDYQKNQIIKHKNRSTNYWKHRVNLLKRLIREYCEPKIKLQDKKKIIAVDIGCSIGTMAIEISKMGYNSFGIDFDPKAITIANKLAEEENAKVNFIQEDIANWNQNFPPIDIAICFDIFEHLHDDQIGSFLQIIKKQLSPDGTIVFHTFPNEYDHLFYNSIVASIPLMFFFFLPSGIFSRIVKIYSCLIDSLLIFLTGKKFKEIITSKEHCNPTTSERLRSILEKSGYEILYLNSSNLYSFKKFRQWIFSKHSIAKRNIYGVAILKKINQKSN